MSAVAATHGNISSLQDNGSRLSNNNDKERISKAEKKKAKS